MAQNIIIVSQTSVAGQAYTEIPAGKTLDAIVINKFNLSVVTAKLTAILASSDVGAMHTLAQEALDNITASTEEQVFNRYAVQAGKTRKISLNIKGREE